MLMVRAGLLAAVLTLAPVVGADAGNHEYRPQPGVNHGGAMQGGMPGGIPPECQKETTRADMVDCIKEKARERGKANVMKGKKPY